MRETCASNITYSNRCIHILSEHNSLRFNHKEVDELLHIVQKPLKRSLWDREILSRSELRSQPFAKGDLSSKLRSRRYCFL